MPNVSLAGSALLLGFLTTSASAETLPLPDRLIDARSEQGGALLGESRPRDTYLQITSVFETQQNQAYCGIASLVMVLNALQVPAPTSPEYKPYAVFTQANVLDEATDAILPRTELNRRGTALDELGQLLARHPVKVEVHHAETGGLDAFRERASGYLKTKDHFVLVNYLRSTIDQGAGAHISPLAAYDAKTDRFLILDVARYKYPPAWVTASDLFDAMNTVTSLGKTRGYVLVAKSDRPNP